MVQKGDGGFLSGLDLTITRPRVLFRDPRMCVRGVINTGRITHTRKWRVVWYGLTADMKVLSPGCRPVVGEEGVGSDTPRVEPLV